MKCVTIKAFIFPVHQSYRDRWGHVSLSLSLSFLCYLFESEEEGKKSTEGKFTMIFTLYVMNFQIPLRHKIESIKSPGDPLAPTFLTLLF